MPQAQTYASHQLAMAELHRFVLVVHIEVNFRRKTRLYLNVSASDYELLIYWPLPNHTRGSTCRSSWVTLSRKNQCF